MKITIFQPNIRAYRYPLFESLVKEFGWDCTICYGESPDESPEKTSCSRVKTPCFKVKGFNIQSKIQNFISLSDVNIVCFDLHWPLPIIFGLLFKSKFKLLFWGHGLGRSELAAKIKLWLINRSQGIIVYGYEGKKELLKRGVEENKIYVAPNTIFVGNAEDCSKQEKKHFLYVGRLQERKGLDQLLQSFALYKKGGGRYHLVILGDGNILKDLKKQAEYLDLSSSVIFENGTTEEEKLRSIFAHAAAYVSPGAVGLGLLHAFSYGVPVVTMNKEGHGPEIEWLENGRNGFLVSPDVEILSKVLMRLDKNQKDAMEMGAEAFLTYKYKVNPEIMLQGFSSAVNHALGHAV